MDLGAFSQISRFKESVENSGILIPRCRGYRLMSEEPTVSAATLTRLLHSAYATIYERAVTSCPPFHPDSSESEYSLVTDRRAQKYLIRDNENQVIGFRWELIHGRNRKAVRFSIKKMSKAVKRQYEIWNKYAGKPGILYIHARIGGNNWNVYGGAELEKQPWFIERVDDWFDSTYCDIYARVNLEECDDNT